VSAGVEIVSLGLPVLIPANSLNKEVIRMKNPNSRNMPTLRNGEAAAFHGIAEKMGERISQVVDASLKEMLFLIMERRRQTALQQGTFTPSDKFLTASDIAKELKASKLLAYHMIKTREIPTFSIGGTVRVRRWDLEAFVQAHMVGSLPV
jgi:excisionase family DNA binding protein